MVVTSRFDDAVIVKNFITKVKKGKPCRGKLKLILKLPGGIACK
jgi:hypothetical protein